MIEDFENLPQLPPIVGPAKQIAYIVDDIDVAINHWHTQYGVGPFLVTRNAVPLTNAYYRGRRAETTHVNIAFAYIGDMQLEFIELIGDTPGLYKEALDRKNYGVHHYAVLVEDFPSTYNWLVDNGYESVIDAGVDGLARMSYLENNQENLILEVIEWNALTRPYFDGIGNRVKRADSSQLIHEFQLAEITPKAAVFMQLIKFSIKKMMGRVQPTMRAPAENLV